jgi:acyl-CoA thioesterase II
VRPADGSDPGLAVVRPCAYRARAWWGDRLLAESARPLGVDVPGRAPALWVPWEDVRTDALRAAGREAWDGGGVERFDAVGPVPVPSPSPSLESGGSAGWTSSAHAAGDDAPPIDGKGLVRRCTVPPPGLQVLAGYAVVDHDRARVELIDAVEGTEARDVTVKRFPTWGDAEDLVTVLDTGALIPDHRRPVVEGSQMLGQAIVAAMRQAPGRRVASAHMLFLRAADARRPVDIRLDPLSKGRTFTAFAAHAAQEGRLCADGTLLLGAPAADVVRHAAPLDGVPGPYDAVPYDMGVTGRDLRVVDGAYTDDPAAPAGPPSIDAWLRFRGIPDDPALHAGLLAQFTGHMSVAAALRPHAGVGQRSAHHTLSTAINAIAIAFHADVRVDRWVLYRHLSTVAADGMTHAECRVYDEGGELVASFSVDAMVRPLDRSAVAGSPALDARTAL